MQKKRKGFKRAAEDEKLEVLDLVACRGATITRLRIGYYGHRGEPVLTQ